jgi:tetratricopeptide (TPR) repeat protein
MEEEDGEYYEKENEDTGDLTIVANVDVLRKRKKKHRAHNVLSSTAVTSIDSKYKNYPPYLQAGAYYESRLAKNPSVSRYTHFMGALSTARGEVADAGKYYRETIQNAPQDVLARNDFAIHLHDQGRKEEAIKEMKKASLIVSEHGFLEKNYAAIEGNAGQFQSALNHARIASHLLPNDDMNHRNLAKLQNALGDSNAALEHNLLSIKLEEQQKQMNPHYQPHTSAYRAAAVQWVAKGGNREQAIELLHAARHIEKKQVDLLTSNRTYEIIDKIKRLQGDRWKQLEAQKEAEMKRKEESVKRWQTILHGLVK